MFPSFFDNEEEFIFYIRIEREQSFQYSQGKCFYGNRFIVGLNKAEAKMHDLAVVTGRDIHVLQDPDSISFYGIVQAFALYIFNQFANMLADQFRVDGCTIAQRPAGTLCDQRITGKKKFEQLIETWLRMTDPGYDFSGFVFLNARTI